MSATTALRALALAMLMATPAASLAQAETADETGLAQSMGQTPDAVPATGADAGALLEAERAGRLAAAIEENDRLRGEVERLTRGLAAARTRVDVLTEQRGERALITAAGIALAGVVAGMILGRLAAGRRRRGGF